MPASDGARFSVAVANTTQTMKFLIFVTLAVAVFAAPGKKPEKRGALSLGYGGYGSLGDLDHGLSYSLDSLELGSALDSTPYLSKAILPGPIISKAALPALSAPLIAKAYPAPLYPKVVLSEPIITKAVLPDPILTKAVVSQPLITKTILPDPELIAIKNLLSEPYSPYLTKTILPAPTYTKTAISTAPLYSKTVLPASFLTKAILPPAYYAKPYAPLGYSSYALGYGYGKTLLH